MLVAVVSPVYNDANNLLYYYNLLFTTLYGPLMISILIHRHLEEIYFTINEVEKKSDMKYVQNTSNVTKNRYYLIIKKVTIEADILLHVIYLLM